MEGLSEVAMGVVDDEEVDSKAAVRQRGGDAAEKGLLGWHNSPEKRGRLLWMRLWTVQGRRRRRKIMKGIRVWLRDDYV